MPSVSAIVQVCIMSLMLVSCRAGFRITVEVKP